MGTQSFNLNFHIRSNIDDVKHKKKVSKEGKLNLSSNELLHERLYTFNKELLSKINIDSISSYRYYPKDISYIANFFNLSTENMLLTAGSDDAIKIIINSMIKTTGRLIIPYPNYENYLSYAKLNQIEVKLINFSSNYSYKHSIQDLEKSIITSPPSSVVISNPNGFSGEYFTYDEMYYIAKICQEQNHLLIIDEAYSAFGDIDHIKLLNYFNNIVIIRSFSKSFGLAGMRISAIFSSSEIISYISNWNPVNPITGVTLEIFKFYLNHLPFIKSIQNDIKENRQFISKYLPIIFDVNKIVRSKGNFILISLGDSDKANFLTNYLSDNNIIVRNLNHIETLQGCVRMTIGSKAIMKPVLTKFKDYHLKK